MAKKIAEVSTIEDALNALAENIVPIEEFNSLGAYEYPLRSERPVVLKMEDDSGQEILSLVSEDKEGAIVNLHLPWQVMLFEKLKPKYGPLEHGGFERQFLACYSPDGQSYKRNVLTGSWAYTGEVGKQLRDGSHEFGRLVKVEPVTNASLIVFEDEKPVRYADYRLVIRRSQINLPQETGMYRVGDVEGNVYWVRVYLDSQGRSAVRCDWNPVQQRLGADAIWPLDRDDRGVVAAWRKAA